MQKFALAAAASAFLTIGGVGAAYADDCSGRDHSTGTVVGAAGGAAIGGLASHSIAGAVVGGVVGGVAGNAIDRAQDCDSAQRQAYIEEERDRARAYRAQTNNEGYSDHRNPNDAPVTLVVRPGDPDYPN